MAIMSQKDVKENLLLPDVGGYVKATANASPRYASQLRKLPGLEECLIVQPLVGRVGHLVYGLGMLPNRRTLEVEGYDNLFCAGTKSSHALFIMDVVLSGDLAGLNAARKIHGLTPMELPGELMTGAFLAFCREAKASTAGLSSIPQGDRATLTKLGVLREESSEIRAAVAQMGLTDVYRTPLI
jgi:folate-dependent tRNA-U54 methylase TrmFO/GidA